LDDLGLDRENGITRFSMRRPWLGLSVIEIGENRSLKEQRYGLASAHVRDRQDEHLVILILL
jgi:hypothetical protein